MFYIVCQKCVFNPEYVYSFSKMKKEKTPITTIATITEETNDITVIFLLFFNLSNPSFVVSLACSIVFLMS